MGYPKTLYKTVNSVDEENQAISDGCYLPGDPFSEYPKMLYKHPEDKTQEHTFIVVKTEGEAEAACNKGYQEKPHIPVTEKQEDTVIQGSGSERYEAGDWTRSAGQGLTDDTSVLVPEKQDSPKDILEDEHMNDKPNGEHIN